MEVQILIPFSEDTAKGDVHYDKGQIVANGKQNWVDKGLAVPVADDKPAKNTASKE